MLPIGYYLLIISTIPSCITGHEIYKIVHGSNARIEDYPFIVVLEFLSRQHCDGSVISNQWILTAAHCISTFDPLDYRVVTETDQSVGGNKRRVRSVHRNPQYNKEISDYDCGLVKLKEEMVFNRKLQPIKLPQISKTLPVDALVVILGFGYTELKARVSRLLKIRVPIMSHDTCQRCYSDPFLNITNRMFCAGYLRSRKTVCKGDSGGPVVLMNMNIQLGIVSFGSGCGRRGKPVINAFVGNYEMRNYIKRITGI